MIVTEEEKVIFYKEISADSPINNLRIGNLDFYLDKGYRMEWSLAYPETHETNAWIYIQPNGVRNSFWIDMPYWQNDGNGHSSGLPNYVRGDSLAIHGANINQTSPYGSGGEFVISKIPEPTDYGYSWRTQISRDDGVHCMTMVGGGMVHDGYYGPVNEITFIDLVADGTGNGTPVWYGWIKVSKV